jgi:hypothetical protein
MNPVHTVPPCSRSILMLSSHLGVPKSNGIDCYRRPSVSLWKQISGGPKHLSSCIPSLTSARLTSVTVSSSLSTTTSGGGGWAPTAPRWTRQGVCCLILVPTTAPETAEPLTHWHILTSMKCDKMKGKRIRLTAWRLLEELIVAQLVKKLPAVYWKRSLLTMFTWTHLLPLGCHTTTTTTTGHVVA